MAHQTFVPSVQCVDAQWLARVPQSIVDDRQVVGYPTGYAACAGPLREEHRLNRLT